MKKTLGLRVYSLLFIFYLKFLRFNFCLKGAL